MCTVIKLTIVDRLLGLINVRKKGRKIRICKEQKFHWIRKENQGRGGVECKKGGVSALPLERAGKDVLVARRTQVISLLIKKETVKINNEYPK